LLASLPHLLLIIATGNALAWLVLLALFRWHWRQMPIPAPAPRDLPHGRPWPSVTLLMTARDEAAALPAALDSWLAQNYPHLELVLVNDHSSDATGAILDAAAARDPRIAVIHDPHLPPGWFGKNNALWQAAQRATGDWIVMTDADVVMEPDALRRAIAHAEHEGNDIQPMLPRVTVGSWGEGAVLPALTMFGFSWFSPQRARRPGSKRALGIGAFNMARRTAYFAVGGHAAIPGEVLEDVAIARRLRDAGHRYRIVNGTGIVHVRIYHGLGAIVRGFRKNMWAGAERRTIVAALFIVSVLGYLTWPFVASLALLPLILGREAHALWPTEAQSLIVAAWAISLATYVAASLALGSRRIIPSSDAPRWHAWLHPVAGPVLAWTMALSTWDGLVRRRVTWRGRVVHHNDAAGPHPRA